MPSNIVRIAAVSDVHYARTSQGSLQSLFSQITESADVLVLPFPWLGSSRLEEPLTRFEVSAVFHGHAHKGAPEGTTSTGIPVYNVSISVLREHYPDTHPFRLFEVDLSASAQQATAERRQQRRRASDRGSGATASGGTVHH